MLDFCGDTYKTLIKKKKTKTSNKEPGKWPTETSLAFKLNISDVLFPQINL